MKRYRIFFVVLVLAFVSLACRALSGARDTQDIAPDATEPAVIAQPTEEPSSNDNSPVNSDFPIADDAFNVTDMGDGGLLYYTKLSQADVLKFYREAYTAKGYKEREILTAITDGVFSIVFDGDPSGKAVVIQSVDLGDGSSTVALRLEAIP